MYIFDIVGVKRTSTPKQIQNIRDLEDELDEEQKQSWGLFNLGDTSTHALGKVEAATSPDSSEKVRSLLAETYV